MGKEEKVEAADTGKRKIDISKFAGAAPWLKPKDVKLCKAKVFRSGNSLALRLPAGTGLEAGMEMDLRIENGTHFSFEPVGTPKRKFNVGKVWGSATGLELIRPEDRIFEEGSSAFLDSPDGTA